MENNNAVGYVRCSSGDQKESIILQEKQIREYCKFKNINLVDVVIDEDVSGGKEFKKRPGGEKICLYINQNNTNIIATKPDRLFRNVKDALTISEEWNKKNITLHIVDMGGTSFNTRTAIGRFIFTNLIAMSEFERNITGERTKAILDNKKANGKAYTGAILGYDNIDGKMIPNQIEQQTIKLIKSLSEKFKPNRISRILNNTGFRTKTNKQFHPSTIQYILKNKIHNQQPLQIP